MTLDILKEEFEADPDWSSIDRQMKIQETLIEKHGQKLPLETIAKWNYDWKASLANAEKERQ